MEHVEQLRLLGCPLQEMGKDEPHAGRQHEGSAVWSSCRCCRYGCDLWAWLPAGMWCHGVQGRAGPPQASSHWSTNFPPSDSLAYLPLKPSPFS